MKKSIFLLAPAWAPAFAQVDLKFCTITISNGGASDVEIKVGEGNLTYSEKRTIEYTLDRGTLDEVREGDEQPMDVSFDFTWTEASGDIEDALMNKTGTQTSSDSDACRPYACDLVITYQPLPSSCGTGWTKTLPDFRAEDLSFDLRAGQVSCSGKCNAKFAIES